VALSSRKFGDRAVLLDDVPHLAPYYRNGGVSNMVGFFEKVCEEFGVPQVASRTAEKPPVEGIYHPDADHVFADGASYWKWYATRPNFAPDQPKVGVFVYNTLYLDEETDYFTEIIRGLEQAKANPVLGFWFQPRESDGDATSPIDRFFSGVDVLLSSSFRLVNEKPWHYLALQQLNVPVLNSIILNESADEWRRSRQGISASYLLNGIVNPELSGLIEPTVIAARQPVANPNTNQRYYRSMVLADNFQWQIQRALAWARLRRAEPNERRVAILYYNHSGGRQNVGASYLNVTESLDRILKYLASEGYRVEGSIDRQSIADSMLAVGRNVGTWAPHEVDRLVEKGAVLWPVEEYLAYYDQLPSAVRQQISQQWGQPPGDVMTVSRDGRRYFVLPAFQVGNVLLAPQPARALGDRQSSLYHDSQAWPTHQYVAFYFWLQHTWKAHAVVHLGRHGTLEFLPGKSNGLSPEDPSSFLIGQLPNIYPYVVDGIGEAVAAKRRAQAVILTHATPPLTETALYGELAQLQELTNRYTQARDQKQTGLQAEYHKSIAALAAKLGYRGQDTDNKVDGVPDAHNTASRQEQEIEAVEHWLTRVAAQSGPRGLHTFGDSYSAEDVAGMLPRMFRGEFQELRQAGLTEKDEKAWLAELAASKAAKPPQTPLPRDGAVPTRAAADIRAWMESTAWHMRHNPELDYLGRALNGQFIPVGPPGDPLSNPDIFPTGRNQYQYDAAKMPTREAWAVGQRMAEQTLALHRKAHGEFPNKLSVTLWANTLIRTHGALEAEVLYLLGLKPVWDDRGDVKDIELISPLGRSRVDVVMTVTGMYRDSFPEKMLLLDKAVRLANAAPAEAGVKNFVHDNTEKISAELAGKGARPEDSQRLAMLRIFGAQTGSYGTGVGDTLRNSERWSQTAEVAGQYLDRMSFAFSNDAWAQPSREVLELQLRGVQGVIHGRSSNLYGIMDLTENFEYQGALALAIEKIGGKQPDLYVNDLIHGENVSTAREAVVMELLSRYQNPEFIKAMQAEGDDGARYFSRIADNQFGWDVVSDVITADDWRNYSEIYLDDKYQLGMRGFFEKHNPYALENIASRVLEADRKGLQKLDPQTLASAARVYVESVAQYGPSCASHICSNTELAKYAEDLAGASGQLADATLERFRQQLRDTGNAAMAKSAALAGASNKPAQATKPVSGQVLTATKPPVDRTGTKPLAPAAKDVAKDQPVPSPSKNASTHSAQATNRFRMAPLLAAVASVLAFFAGILGRARHRRRATRSGES
jgi:cobaltochelatase CobN